MAFQKSGAATGEASNTEGDDGMNGDNKGCEFCTRFDFTAVGYRFDCGKPSIYHIGGSARVESEHQFKHCPVCGQKLEVSE